MRKAIAIDFDGCLCANAYPAIGEPNWPVIDRAKQEHLDGAGLILWTCREGQLLQDAVSACKNWGLTFDAVNESLPDWIEEFSTTPRKVGASEYWDDRSVIASAEHPFKGVRKFIGGPRDDTIEFVEPVPGSDMVLKPCPFCQSTAVVYEKYLSKVGERWRCWCTNCIAGIDPGWAGDWFKVRDMWNRRAILPNDPLTLEELRKMDRDAVWIERLGSDSPDDREWALVDLEYEMCRTTRGGLAVFEMYGKTWTAYRHKPEVVS